MCETGACPTLVEQNVCYFPALDFDNPENYDTYRIPYSCIHFIPGHSSVPQPVEYQQKLLTACESICNNMGANSTTNEWKVVNTDPTQNYNVLNNYQTASDYSFRCNQNLCGDDNSGEQPFNFNKLSTNLSPAECVLEDSEALEIVGVGCTRNRNIYTGKNISCCLQNLFCDIGDTSLESFNIPLAISNLYNPKCFDSDILSLSSGSCNPTYRRLGNPSCYTTLVNYCTSGTSVEIANKWAGTVQIPSGGTNAGYYTSQYGCLNGFFSTLYSDSDLFDTPISTPGHECFTGYINLMDNDQLIMLPPPNLTNARNAQSLLQRSVQNYLARGGDISAPEGTPGSSYTFNQMLVKLCSQLPGVCQNFLTNYCAATTIDEMRRNPNRITTCGCYLPSSLTSTYTDTFQVNPECVPYCNLPGTIPQPTSFNSYGGKVCQQSVCIINDVTLDFVNSEVGDQGVNIGNFCGNCDTVSGKGVCSCILSDVTFVSINSKISNVNLTQQCTSGTCYTSSIKNGKVIQTATPCNQGISEAKKLPGVDVSRTLAQGFSVIALFIFVFVILIVLYLLIAPNVSIFGKLKMIIEKSKPWVLEQPFNSIKNV